MKNVNRRSSRQSVSLKRGHSFRLPLRSSVCRLTYSVSCLLLLLLSGCETFQPIGDNDRSPFSIYGYLDASADTQWLRVTPLRDKVSQDSVKPEMTVTLEHLESGNTVIMNDSLFQYRQDLYVIAVWTNMDIEPERTYRLRAERPDGASSSVTVTIPPDFPTPVLHTNENGLSGELVITGVEQVADVQTLWQSNKRRVPYRRFVEETDASENIYSVSMRIGYDLGYLFGDDQPSNLLDLGPRQVFVASGGPEWNKDIPSLTDLEYATLESVSNVEGGVGYVVGIVSKTIPFKGCFDDQGKNIACPTEDPFF